VPSAFAHVAPALAMIPIFREPATPRRLWVLGALCAIAPDADVAGFLLGVPYDHALGHRGLSHSLVFAAALAGLLTVALLPRARAGFSLSRAFAYLFLATATHGVLDAFTNGGLGVAFFAPLANERFFFPFRPIQVSPIGIPAFLSERGILILLNEMIWVGVPSIALWLAARAARRGRAEPAR
jgi:inner membrane protein